MLKVSQINDSFAITVLINILGEFNGQTNYLRLVPANGTNPPL